MMHVPRSIGAMRLLAALVALLLPGLAWLQWTWVNQLATADREHRERTLRAAGGQFTSAVDTEISRVGGSLQLDAAMVERRDWDAYALRYQIAADNGMTALVRGIWLAALDESGQATISRWDASARSFATTAWPVEFERVRQHLLETGREHAGDGADGVPSGGRQVFSAMALSDERALVFPVLRFEPPPTGERRVRVMAGVRTSGFTIIGLDLEALVARRLPALVGEHFPNDADYVVAVTAREDERVIYESRPGAAAMTRTTADLSASFMQPRIGSVIAFAEAIAAGRGIESVRPPPPPPPPPPASGEASSPSGPVVSVIEMRDRDGRRSVRARGSSGEPGQWTLRVKHAAGSLEAAVAASRRRNLLLSGGTLALLGVVVALIAVSARRAQALARQQMEFVAAVSHELRTPVAVIHSAAGNLADGVVADPTRVRRYGETIQGEARRLGETVERVLQLAGLGSGRPLPSTLVSVEGIVGAAVERLAGDAAEANIDLQVHVSRDVPAVAGDAGTLQSAVQNLVGNAIKYAGADRFVRVSVTCTPGPRAEIRIAVEDHGAGLALDEQRQVFEPFFRGRDAVANQVPGSGLGLSLVQRIAEAHGGRVDVQSVPGRGSTFTLCLPAAPNTPSPSTTTVSDPAEASPH